MFQGSIPALFTPMTEDGAIDYKALERLVEWQINQGAGAVIPVGTTGENPVLSDDEWQQVITTVVRQVAKRVPVIAGSGGNNTVEVIKKTNIAKELGADAALVVTPYYNKPNPAGVIAHYKAVHDGTDIPIVLYNVPGRTNVDMSVDTVAELSKLERVVGIKDATGDLARVAALRVAVGDDFLQFSGEDITAVGFNAMGGKGCMSVIANIAPRQWADLQAASIAGDMETARALQDKLAPLCDALFCEPSPGPVKYAASLLGLAGPATRLPLVEISDDAKRRVKAAIDYAGLEPVAFDKA